MTVNVDAMIVGASKSGTTGLLRYLGAHPEVYAQRKDECLAFSPHISQSDSAELLAELFAEAGDRLVLAKDAGAYRRPATIERILEHNPECRLILILRDPVDRAHSVFRMAALRGEFSETYAEAIDRALSTEAEGGSDWRVERYLHGGLYVDRCRELFARCDPEFVRVLILEDFERSPGEHYRGLCEWLGIDAGFRPDFDRRVNVGGEPRSVLLARALERSRSERSLLRRSARRLLPEPLFRRVGNGLVKANKRRQPPEPPDDETTARLREYFAEPNARLARLLGREIGWAAPEIPARRGTTRRD
jgi:Sulfotransferase family